MPANHIIPRETKSHGGPSETHDGAVRVSAMVSPELEAALRLRAERTDRSKAAVIRIALAEHLGFAVVRAVA